MLKNALTIAAVILFFYGCATEPPDQALRRVADACIVKLGYQGVTSDIATNLQKEQLRSCMQAQFEAAAAQERYWGGITQGAAAGLRHQTVTTCTPTFGGQVQCVTQ